MPGSSPPRWPASLSGSTRGSPGSEFGSTSKPNSPATRPPCPSASSPSTSPDSSSTSPGGRAGSPLGRSRSSTKTRFRPESPDIDTSGNLVDRLTLPPPRSVTGVVLDVAKKSVEGAEVRVVATGSSSGNQTIVCNIAIAIKATPIEGAVVTRTDSRGRFRFDLLPEDLVVALRTSAEGKATIESNTQSFPTDKADLDKILTQIELPTETRVKGQVVSKVPGLAVLGRRVLLQTHWNDPPSAQSFESPTDTEGRFNLRRLTMSEVGITLGQVPADKPWIFRPATDIMVKPGETIGPDDRADRGDRRFGFARLDRWQAGRRPRRYRLVRSWLEHLEPNRD